MKLLNKKSISQRKVLKEYPIWKYTYHKGSISKEQYLAREYDSFFVYLFNPDGSRKPTGSRDRLDQPEIDNPCTSNINQGVYLSEEDDVFAYLHFDRCLQERIEKAKKIVEQCTKESETLLAGMDAEQFKEMMKRKYENK